MPSAETPARIVIVDDHEVVRRGLASIFETCDDLCVVGIAANGQEAIELTTRLRPDLVLLDLRLPDIHGLDAIPTLLDKGGDHVKILVLTVHDDPEIVLRAVKAGASGYVLKDALADELVRVVRLVAAGGRHFDEIVVDAFLTDQQRAKILDLLTGHELEILKMVAAGATNREIGETLFISSDTVKRHLEIIFRKLEVSDRSQAVAVAMRKGLLQ